MANILGTCLFTSKVCVFHKTWLVFFWALTKISWVATKKLLVTASMAILDEMINIFQGTCKKHSSGLKNFGRQMYLFQHTCRIVLTKFSTQTHMEIQT